MKMFRNILNKLKQIPKEKYIISLVIIIFAVTVTLPTLARYKNRTNVESLLNGLVVWDKTIAPTYSSGNGTKESPFIISNASELALLSERLKTTDYKNTYFKLSNNIIINKGKFNYNETDKITYDIDDTKLYIKESTEEVYTNPEKTALSTEKVNIFPSLNNFNGYFDGNSYTIYGLYLSSNEKNSLFNNLKGTVTNLYVENALVYGGNESAILATSMENATISNTLVNGNVVSTINTKDELINYNINNLEFNKLEESLNEVITLPIITLDEVKSVKLTGNFTTTLETEEVLLNNNKLTPGKFSIDLTLPLQESINLTSTSNKPFVVNLTELNLAVTYNYPVTASLTTKAVNSNIINVINKGNVYGTNAAGLVGILSNTNIENAYNKGKINGTKTSASLVNTIKNSTQEVILNKLYSSCEVAGLDKTIINKILNNNKVTIRNTFNINPLDYTLGEVNNIVKVENLIDGSTNKVKSGTLINDVIPLSSVNIYDKNYLINNLDYSEFVDLNNRSTNTNNVWVYEDNALPILYIDDINTPSATLAINTHTWNNLGYELKDIYVNNSLVFTVTPTSELNPLTEVNYYIADRVLSKNEIDNITSWTKYENTVTSNKEGYNVVYVKVVDSKNKTSYINSERIILDLTGPSTKLETTNNSWNTLNEKPTTLNIFENIDLTVTANDTLGTVKEIEYFLSDRTLTKEELESTKDKWIKYQDKITINSKGNYVVYVKTTDNSNNVTYINSSIIVYGGYEEELYLDKTTTNQNELQVTSNSRFSYNFKYSDYLKYEEGLKSNIITNILLPKNTLLTLKDNITNTIYSYKIDTDKDNFNYNNSCTTDTCTKYATYPLTLFKKISTTNNINFNDQEYLSNTNKDLTLTLDLKDTVELTNDLKLYLNITDSSNKELISTLRSSIKLVHLYSSSNYTYDINTNSIIPTISYNTNSTTNIEINSIVNKTNNIIDTTNINNKLGLMIKLVDENNSVVPKHLLKNIEFIVNNTNYTPDNDGIVRIKINDIVDTTTTNLTIKTHEANLKLKTGNYNFIITNVISSDGKYGNNIFNKDIKVPLTTTYIEQPTYGFNVIIDNKFKVLNSKNQKAEIPISIVNESNFENPVVKLSLYKKNNLTAYDQTYEIVNLESYSINTLTKLETNKFNVPTSLNLNLSKMEHTGYELRFELYDNDNLVSTIKKKFIVR